MLRKEIRPAGGLPGPSASLPSTQDRVSTDSGLPSGTTRFLEEPATASESLWRGLRSLSER